MGVIYDLIYTIWSEHLRCKYPFVLWVYISLRGWQSPPGAAINAAHNRSANQGTTDNKEKDTGVKQLCLCMHYEGGGPRKQLGVL